MPRRKIRDIGASGNKFYGFTGNHIYEWRPYIGGAKTVNYTTRVHAIKDDDFEFRGFGDSHCAGNLAAFYFAGFSKEISNENSPKIAFDFLSENNEISQFSLGLDSHKNSIISNNPSKLQKESQILSNKISEIYSSPLSEKNVQNSLISNNFAVRVEKLKDFFHAKNNCENMPNPNNTQEKFDQSKIAIKLLEFPMETKNLSDENKKSICFSKTQKNDSLLKLMKVLEKAEKRLEIEKICYSLKKFFEFGDYRVMKISAILNIFKKNLLKSELEKFSQIIKIQGIMQKITEKICKKLISDCIKENMVKISIKLNKIFNILEKFSLRKNFITIKKHAEFNSKISMKLMKISKISESHEINKIITNFKNFSNEKKIQSAKLLKIAQIYENLILKNSLTKLQKYNAFSKKINEFDNKFKKISTNYLLRKILHKFSTKIQNIKKIENRLCKINSVKNKFLMKNTLEIIKTNIENYIQKIKIRNGKLLALVENKKKYGLSNSLSKIYKFMIFIRKIVFFNTKITKISTKCLQRKMILKFNQKIQNIMKTEQILIKLNKIRNKFIVENSIEIMKNNVESYKKLSLKFEFAIMKLEKNISKFYFKKLYSKAIFLHKISRQTNILCTFSTNFILKNMLLKIQKYSKICEKRKFLIQKISVKTQKIITKNAFIKLKEFCEILQKRDKILCKFSMILQKYATFTQFHKLLLHLKHAQNLINLFKKQKLRNAISTWKMLMQIRKNYSKSLLKISKILCPKIQKAMSNFKQNIEIFYASQKLLQNEQKYAEINKEHTKNLQQKEQDIQKLQFDLAILMETKKSAKNLALKHFCTIIMLILVKRFAQNFEKLRKTKLNSAKKLDKKDFMENNFIPKISEDEIVFSPMKKFTIDENIEISEKNKKFDLSLKLLEFSNQNSQNDFQNEIIEEKCTKSRNSLEFSLNNSLCKNQENNSEKIFEICKENEILNENNRKISENSLNKEKIIKMEPFSENENEPLFIENRPELILPINSEKSQEILQNVVEIPKNDLQKIFMVIENTDIINIAPHTNNSNTTTQKLINFTDPTTELIVLNSDTSNIICKPKGKENSTQLKIHTNSIQLDILNTKPQKLKIIENFISVCQNQVKIHIQKFQTETTKIDILQRFYEKLCKIFIKQKQNSFKKIQNYAQKISKNKLGANSLLKILKYKIQARYNNLLIFAQEKKQRIQNKLLNIEKILEFTKQRYSPNLCKNISFSPQNITPHTSEFLQKYEPFCTKISQIFKKYNLRIAIKKWAFSYSKSQKILKILSKLINMRIVRVFNEIQFYSKTNLLISEHQKRLIKFKHPLSIFKHFICKNIRKYFLEVMQFNKKISTERRISVLETPINLQNNEENPINIGTLSNFWQKHWKSCTSDYLSPNIYTPLAPNLIPPCATSISEPFPMEGENTSAIGMAEPFELNSNNISQTNLNDEEEKSIEKYEEKCEEIEIPKGRYDHKKFMEAFSSTFNKYYKELCEKENEENLLSEPIYNHSQSSKLIKVESEKELQDLLANMNTKETEETQKFLNNDSKPCYSESKLTPQDISKIFMQRKQRISEFREKENIVRQPNFSRNDSEKYGLNYSKTDRSQNISKNIRISASKFGNFPNEDYMNINKKFVQEMSSINHELNSYYKCSARVPRFKVPKPDLVFQLTRYKASIHHN